MELKVWVEGIQRVVCGVTDVTTCQDVVYALAHATGQMGRFTLVERWRNNERLLAPHENPLKVLMKWGEYANDVQFVMRRSHSDMKSPGQVQQNNNKRHHDFLHSFSPTGASKNTKGFLQSKEIKKSLTFSGGHGSSGGSSSGSSSSTPTTSAVTTPCKVDPLSRDRSREPRLRQDVPRGVVKGVPQRREPSRPNLDTPDTVRPANAERPKHPPSYDEAISRSSSRYTPPSHLLPVSASGSPHIPDHDSPSSKRRHLGNTRNDHASKEQGLSSAHNKENMDLFLTGYNSSDSIEPEHNAETSERKSTGQSSPDMLLKRALSPSKPHDINFSVLPASCVKDGDGPKGRKNVVSHTEDSSICAEGKQSSVRTSHFKSPNTSKEEDPQYRDLVRLVSLQREKLSNQQAELTQYDTEIVYWEGRLRDQEEKLNALEDEIRLLEQSQHEQDMELNELERRSLLEEAELGRQEERTFRSEITLARSKLANCETELLQCRQKVRHLLDQITEERRWRTLREEKDRQEREEQERNLQLQVTDLENKLREKMDEYEKQSVSLEKLEDVVKEVEGTVTEKQDQIDKLVQEIREANLQSLAMTPAEEIKSISEGNFCNRPGSTRKIMGSPRQLENAVPTNKNPHGVWV